MWRLKCLFLSCAQGADGGTITLGKAAFSGFVGGEPLVSDMFIRGELDRTRCGQAEGEDVFDVMRDAWCVTLPPLRENFESVALPPIEELFGRCGNAGFFRNFASRCFKQYFVPFA